MKDSKQVQKCWKSPIYYNVENRVRIKKLEDLVKELKTRIEELEKETIKHLCGRVWEVVW